MDRRDAHGYRSGVQAGTAGGEVVAFGCVAGQQQGLVVGEAGLVEAAEPAEVFGASGGQVVVADQLRLGGDGVEGGQPGGGPAGLAEGDGAVEGHDRGGPDRGELVVQGQDLRPVGGLVAGRSRVRGGDGGHQRVAGIRAALQRLAGEGQAFTDLAVVPRAAVLVGQHEQPAGRVGAGGPAGVGEEDEGEQPGHARVVREQQPQHPGQVQGSFGQVTALQGGPGWGGVPGGEDQVHYVQHAGQPLRQLVGAGNPVGDAGGGDLLLGPGDPGSHGRLAGQERAGDLGGGQPAQQPQGE